MEKPKIEARLERILEQLSQTGEPSDGEKRQRKLVRKIGMSSSDEQKENYDQSTTFSDHSDWSDSWD